MRPEDEQTPDPGRLPDDPEETAADTAGVDEDESAEGREPPEEDLTEDPAHSPGHEADRYRGG
jgi:hypothetical protein